MNLDAIGGAGGAWIAVALLLGVAELAAPGLFLVFVAIAAAATGAVTLALPGLPLVVQLLAFALWSAVAVGIGRRWYQRYPVGTADALLNDRSARLLGEIVAVDAPIVGGHGRVRIGDGTWPARGPDLPAGARARITGIAGGIVEVEAIATPGAES